MLDPTKAVAEPVAPSRPNRFDAAAMWLTTVAAAIALLTLVGLVLIAVPNARETLNDFDTEVPAITVWVIDMSTPTAAVLLAVGAVGLFVMSFLLRRRPMTAIAALWLVLVLTLVVSGVGVLALYLPIVKVLQSVM